MKFDEKKHFFVVCEKCGNKIFEHKGYMEHPKGFFTFAVECRLCGYEFHHKMASEKAHLQMQSEKMIKGINPKAIKELAKKMIKGGD